MEKNLDISNNYVKHSCLQSYLQVKMTNTAALCPTHFSSHASYAGRKKYRDNKEAIEKMTKQKYEVHRLKLWKHCFSEYGKWIQCTH